MLSVNKIIQTIQNGKPLRLQFVYNDKIRDLLADNVVVSKDGFHSVNGTDNDGNIKSFRLNRMQSVVTADAIDD